MQEHQAPVSGRLLRPKGVAEKLGIGLSTVWKYVKTDPGFPAAIRMSPRCTVFLESQVDEYIARRVAESQRAA